MNTEREKVMDTIRKLAAMANPENGAFEQEIATASAKMQKMMDEYNISLVDVMNTEGKDSNIFVRAYGTIVFGSLKPWHWHLARAIGRITSTKHFASSRTGKTKYNRDTKGDVMSFFGAPDAVKQAVELFDEWSTTIDKMSTKATSEYITEWEAENWKLLEDAGVKQMRHLRGLEDEHPNVWRGSWLNGCVSAINSALHEQEEKRTQQTSTALMVVSKKLDEASKIEFSGFRNVSLRSSGGMNSSAYAKGHNAGSKMGIGAKKLGA